MMKNLILSNNKIEEQSGKIRDRYRNSDSEWVASFSCAHLKILIVCRGPIRKEAMDIFTELGAEYGILLSEKDSVTYPATLAPELRVMKDQSRIHRVVDYSGASSEERRQRIDQIIQIARNNRYTHIFAGYGFMAEDAEFVEAIEKAGVGFIGPASNVHRLAGSKDTAKTLARELDVSVTPGLDNISALTLIRKTGNSLDGLKKLAAEKKFEVDLSGDNLEEIAERILTEGYAKSVGLITVEDLQSEATKVVENLLKENPGKRFRLKYIGGGGGKGQRIVKSADEVSNAVVEALSESKAMGHADNKNFLIELNVETTRHNEIQLIGNGEWCIALGGRDCSVQMHEQKLLELSITDELFAHEIDLAIKEGKEGVAKTLEKDKQSLRDMETQAERFGQAVSLNSASTFECIVSGDDFFFMEMNTRIQVEHRVTEMAYTLRFENPYNENDFFVVESIVEAMVLIAAHGSRLPRPVRVPNNKAGGEVRLNATDDALKPHAGGVIQYWSPPEKHEIRDDQGICIRNPDTGWFMNYHLAGAYDSNIALIVTYGGGRQENLERLADILRRTELRGIDLKTNSPFHYGLLNFIMGLHPMLKPDTSFVVPYLTAVGSLAKEIEGLDASMAWEEYNRKVGMELGSEAQGTLMPKLTFITRPLQLLMKSPHHAVGWLISHYNKSFTIENDRVKWLRNPLFALKDLYEYLYLEWRENTPPSLMIWEHDRDLLLGGIQFYSDLENALEIDTEKDYIDARNNHRKNDAVSYLNLNRSLREEKNPFPTGVHGIQSDAIDNELFSECRAAHLGWQLGIDLLELIILPGQKAGIFDFEVGDDLAPVIPEKFKKEEDRKEYFRYLSPPPAASTDLIVAVSGGMFYARETPDTPPYLEKDSRFKEGDPLYIIEVMKMFNKVYAEFSGTVEECLQDGDTGVIVKKGDPLFRVKPDVEIRIESEEEKEQRIRNNSKELVNQIFQG